MIPRSAWKRLSQLKPLPQFMSDWERVIRWVRLAGVERLQDRPHRVLRVADAVGGGRLDNMTPTITQVNEEGEKTTLYPGGLDQLDLTVYGTTDTAYQHRGERCAQNQAAMKEAKQKTGFEFLAGRLWVLHREGMGRGFSRRPYRLEHCGIVIGFGPPTGLENKPLLFVEIHSTAFLAMGEVKAIGLVRETLEALGVQVLKVRVRRIDLCVDLPGVDVREFYNAFLPGEHPKGQAVTWGGVRHHIDYRGRVTGVTVQGAANMIRIYEKLIETENDPIKRQLMIEHRWGGVLPEKATRVEVQIRPGDEERLELRNFGDMLNSLQTIISRVTRSWCRLVKHRRRTHHTDRAVMLPIWADVVASFEAWTEGDNVSALRREAGPCNVVYLAKSALGVAAKVCALMKSLPESADVFQQLLNGSRDPEAEALFRARVIELQV